MYDEFILTVGDTQFLLGLDEAMSVARTLNSASVLGKEWLPDVKAGQNRLAKHPCVTSAVVSPVTAILRMELERNQRLYEERNK